MKKPFAILVAAVLLAVGCDDFHTSDNGDLDGFWQLTNVDTLATGHSADVRDQHIFWSVQANLLEVWNMRSTQTQVLFRFEHDGQHLTLSDPVANNRDISDSLITDVSTISYYGLSHLRETLQVLQLNSKKMTLQSERLRMYFRKY